MTSLLAWRALAAASLAWLASLPVAAYAAALPHPSGAARLFAGVIYGIGAMVCHQRPERSFYLWGAQFPVCARCTGVYVGAVAAVVAAPFGAHIRHPRLGLAMSAAPALATLVYEWGTGAMPAHVVRALTGIILGAAVMLVLRAELRGE